MWLRDSGILNRLMYDIVPSLNNVPVSILRNNLPLTIVQLGVTMILFLIGIAFSIFTFFMEVVLCKRKKNVLHPNDLEQKESDAIRSTSNSYVAVL